MNPQVDFWEKSYNWPRDSADFTFLARALHLLGRATFEDEWTGNETKIELYQSLPANPPHVATGTAYFAHSLLMQRRPDLDRKPVRWAGDRVRGFAAIPPPVSFTKDEWAIALSIVKENHDRHRPALLRLYQVKDRIIELAESDQLITAVRPLAGGNPTIIPSSWWNTERAYSRFDFCQMNPKKPFSVGSAGDDYCWIYVRRDSLAAVLDKITGAEQVEDGSGLHPVQDDVAPISSVRRSSNQHRASLQSIRAAVDDLIKRNPSATMRQADELATSIGAPRDAVREELRQVRSKIGSEVRLGRPKKG